MSPASITTSNISTNQPATHFETSLPVNMGRVAAVIMGGGQGSRLAPLTNARCKPAVSFGGRYRLIDIAMSNAINSGCQKIYVLTQFLAASLHKHICSTYHMSSFSPNYIELLSAEQKPSRNSWYLGTADAVRKNLEYLAESPADYFLILSGDQLYNFNFKDMVQFSLETDADLVIAALPVNESDAKRMGILKFNEDRSITEFQEKPQTRSVLDQMRMSDYMVEQVIDKEAQKQKRFYLGSMGIYLFKREALFKLLQDDEREDFGKHLIPTKVKQGKVSAYVYNGYWEDIGTIDSFYQANMALTTTNPPLNCHDATSPIRFHQGNLPPPKIIDSHIKNSIICDGCFIEADEVSGCILGPRVVVKGGTILRNSYVMGNDYYSPPSQIRHIPSDLSIGEHCLIDRTIIDHNVHIGNGVQLINKDKHHRYEGENVFIRDGIIIVTSGANIPDGFVL